MRRQITKFLTAKYWLIIHSGFFLAFLVQFTSIVQDLLHPSQTTTSIQEHRITEIPILFKICVNPGFNLTKIKEEGYSDSYHYFLGRSKYSNTSYSWSGKSVTVWFHLVLPFCRQNLLSRLKLRPTPDGSAVN